MPNDVWLNDRFVPADQARIPAFDPGFLHGAGLFETMLAHNGDVFRIGQHLARIKNSADALGLALPDSLDAIPHKAIELLQRNHLSKARLRLTVTPGPPAETQRPTLLLSAAPLEPYPDNHYKKGISVLISSRRQTPHDAACAHKTIGHHNRLLALRDAAAASCTEALWFTPEGALAEACISNVFLVRMGKLLTPPLDTPILPGITRAAIIEIASTDCSVEQTRLTIDDLLDADEVFLTNIIMKVMPVCHVERKEIGTGKPGPVTRDLSRAFGQLVQRECENAAQNRN